MKILMVTERYLPVWGGAENQLRQLIPHLVRQGCRVEIVTRRWHPDMDRQEKIDATLVHRLGVPGTGVLKTFFFVAALFSFLLRNSRKFHVCHSHGAVNMGALCRVARVFTGRKNVAKIASAGRIHKLESRLSGKLILALFKQADAIIAMTPEIEGELAAINTSAKRIHCITNGVDCSRFKPRTDAGKQAWKKEQGFSPEERVVLFLSRLVPGKGLRVLLDAWPAVHEKNPDCLLCIVGSGKDQSASIEQEVHEKVQRQRLANVRFAGETDRPEECLGGVDLFVFPSRQEGFPNALMEAMAAGLPVVASRIGGVSELVSDNENGLLFTSGDSRNLADRILRLLENDSLARAMGQQARQTVLDNFAFPRIASQYTALYRTLAGRNE
jgi:glycosyltransferase involved in cell wall biosynthesis